MKWKQIVQKNYAQLLCVFLAFFLMVTASYFAISRIVEKNLRDKALESLLAAEARIMESFSEADVALSNTSFTVQNMLARGEAPETIQQYLDATTRWMRRRESGTTYFMGVYGYIKGEFFKNFTMNPPAGYIPQDRPWYQTAVRSGGKTVYTAPYYTEPYENNEENKKLTVISAMREIFDDEGGPQGIIALDMDISWLAGHTRSLKVAEGSYGLVANQYLTLAAHPDSSRLGLQLRELGGDYREISDRLLRGEEITAVKIRDANGLSAVAFFRRIFNGWYIAVVTPQNKYYRDVYVTAGMLSALGGVCMVFLAGVLLRISAAKMRSDEENRSKTSFLARMSHEIRTPMNAIIGMSELVSREYGKAAGLEYLDAIKTAGTNLLSIINDILDFSKIESNALQIVNAPYHVASLLNDIINVIRVRASEKNLMFLVDVDPRMPGQLNGDEARIRQILLNILGNAAKYTLEGFIRLSVTWKRANDASGLQLSFAISDSCIGVKAEDLGNLFGDFVRVDMERNRTINGTGLGLSISRSLCRAMGGNILAESVYGQGSTFTATLPQSLAVAEEPLALVGEAHTHKVLLRDDRRLYAASVAKTLADLGVEARDAKDADEFRRELGSDEYSTVFVSEAEADAAKKLIKELSLRARIVLLMNIGDIMPPSGSLGLMMPAWAVPIANALNGESGLTFRKGMDVAFTAPQARILIVDDIATNLQVASGLLANYALEIHTCLSGEQAVEMVKANEYDFVLMDHMMPGLDGLEATARIRALRGERFRALPIIMLTANAYAGMREMFLSKGLDDYLAKPIEISKLNEIMEKWVPREKRLKAGASGQAEAGPAFSLEIDGLDTAAGLAATGGTEKGYWKVLEFYQRDAAERLGFFHNFAVRPAAESIPSLITQAHALKSASASIGAAEISRTAFRLEQAGRRGDMAAVREQIGEFCEKLAALERTLEEALSARAPVLEAGGQAGIGEETALRLRQALLRQDVGTVDALVAELRQKGPEERIGAALDKIEEAVLLAEYDQAVRTLDEAAG